MKLSHSQKLTLRNKCRRKGFSLVEVIIAIGIVALLLTGFLGVFGSAQKNINRSLGVKEANMLKDSLETEMSTYRSNEVATYESSFDKAFEMIKNSSTAQTAVIIFQYKADPVDNDSDGILPPFAEDSGSPGIQGSNYLTQVAVRKLGTYSDSILKAELDNNVVVGNVYAVRMTQLVKDTASGDLKLSTNVTQILNEDGEVAADHTAYNKAVITYQAEFFRIPSNSHGFVTSSNWDFTTMGNPVAVINMAVRR